MKNILIVITIVMCLGIFLSPLIPIFLYHKSLLFLLLLIPSFIIAFAIYMMAIWKIDKMPEFGNKNKIW